MNNYYELLEIDQNLSFEEIEVVLDKTYNQWRSLTSHHDQEVVIEANKKLLHVEDARTILLDPNKRREYDLQLKKNNVVGGIGIDGDKVNPFNHMQAGKRKVSIDNQTGDQIDMWLCKNCGKASRPFTKNCAQCGSQLSQSCPNCNQVNHIDAVFCEECGVNINEEYEKQEQVRQEREAQLIQNHKDQQMRFSESSSIRQKAESAEKMSSFWWVLLGFGPILWLIAFIQSRQVINSPISQKYPNILNQAKRANRNSSIMLIIVGILFLCQIIFLILAAVNSY